LEAKSVRQSGGLLRRRNQKIRSLPRTFSRVNFLQADAGGVAAGGADAGDEEEECVGNCYE
jgi:hypothetical protein